MVDRNRELADFLRRARGSVDPAQAGLGGDDRVRRVAGLRREEVALRAGVSPDYYSRLEQGRKITPSAQVLDSLATALQLDAAGRAYLGRLVHPDPSSRRAVTTEVRQVRPGLRRLIDGLDRNPALILGRRTDVLAANHLAKALLTDFEALPARERNYARWVFLDAAARSLMVNWETQARAVVENLRMDFGKYPNDAAAQQLIADLSSRSPEFDQWWKEHRVFQRTYGSKEFRHPLVGEIKVDYETLTLPGDPDVALFIYTAEPGSDSLHRLGLLAASAEAPGHLDDAGATMGTDASTLD